MSKEILKQANEAFTNWESAQLAVKIQDTHLVKAVCFADPPGLCQEGITTDPRAWASASVDKLVGMKIEDLKFGKVVAAAWHEGGGPVIVIECLMQDIVHAHQRHRDNEISLSLKGIGICAEIYYTPNCRYPGLTICDEAVVEEVEITDVGGGCNDASYMVYPCAPNFSKQIVTAKKTGCDSDGIFKSRVKLTVTDIRKLFPDIDFNCNKIMESLTYAMCFDFGSYEAKCQTSLGQHKTMLRTIKKMERSGRILRASA